MKIKGKVLAILTVVMCSLMSIVSFASEASSTSDPTKTTTTQPTTWWIWILIYGGMIALFYVFLIRPNKKKQKNEANMRDSVILGDEITSIGGIVGRVVNIKDDEITIESSIDKTLVQFKKWAIRDVKKVETDD